MHHLEPSSLDLDIDSLQSPYLQAIAQAARAAGVHVSGCTYDPAMLHPASVVPSRQQCGTFPPAVWYLPDIDSFCRWSSASDV
eukprot:2500186-Prymnesium_polylepis.1